MLRSCEYIFNGLVSVRDDMLFLPSAFQRRVLLCVCVWFDSRKGFGTSMSTLRTEN